MRNSPPRWAIISTSRNSRASWPSRFGFPRWIAFWALAHSFGQFGMMGSQEQRENLSIHRPWRGENRFLDRVFKVETFKKLYLARLDEFNKTIFNPERFHHQVDEIAAAIRPAVQEESDEKLARFDKVAAGEPV